VKQRRPFVAQLVARIERSEMRDRSRISLPLNPGDALNSDYGADHAQSMVAICNYCRAPSPTANKYFGVSFE
jgi:hypothetical protein